MTKPDLAVGRTYAGVYNDERIVLELKTGVAPYNSGSSIPKIAPLVRYRHGTAPGNTERLRGREYVCTVASFRGWMRREVGT